MVANVFFNALQAIDANGDAVSGAKAYFYDTGTANLQTVYTDATLTAAHPSPLVADSSGVFAAVFQSGSTDIKVNMTDSSDVDLPGYPIDPVILHSTAGGASTVSFAPTPRIAATDAQNAIEEVDGDVEAIEDSRTIEKSVYTTAGSTTAYTLAVTDATTYATGDRYWVRANATNTGACTLNVESVGAKNIKKYNSSGSIGALAANDFVKGSEYLLHYDGTQFVIISERYARAADSIWETGTSPIQYGVSPANMKAAIDALSPISAKDFSSSGQTITTSGSLTLAHSLGSEPKIAVVRLVCTIADGTWEVDDIIVAHMNSSSASFSKINTISWDATNVYINFTSNASCFIAAAEGGGGSGALTNANWDLYVRAWA